MLEVVDFGVVIGVSEVVMMTLLVELPVVVFLVVGEVVLVEVVVFSV